ELQDCPVAAGISAGGVAAGGAWPPRIWGWLAPDGGFRNSRADPGAQETQDDGADDPHHSASRRRGQRDAGARVQGPGRKRLALDAEPRRGRTEQDRERIV